MDLNEKGSKVLKLSKIMKECKIKEEEHLNRMATFDDSSRSL